MSAIRGNVPDLSQSRGVQIAQLSVLIPAGVDVFADGMAQPGCDVSLRVIDVPRAHALYVPMPAHIARELARQLNETADLMEAPHGV